MSIFYSASTNQFYLEGLGEIPDDGVRITRSRHSQLLAAQAAGSAIIPGKGGKPELKSLRPPLASRREAIVLQIKAEAERRIALFAPIWRQLNIIRSGDLAAITTLGQRIDAIREASNLIEATLADLDGRGIDNFYADRHPAWPEFDEEKTA